MILVKREASFIKTESDESRKRGTMCGVKKIPEVTTTVVQKLTRVSVEFKNSLVVFPSSLSR